MPANLTPEQIQQLMALMQGGGAAQGTGSQTWWDPQGKFGAMLSNQGGGQQIGGDAGYFQPNAPTLSFGSDNGDGTGNSYDAQGNYTGTASRDDGHGGVLLKLAALGLGGAALGGSGLLSGLGGAGGTALGDAATASAWGSGAGLGGDTLSAMGMGGAGGGAATGLGAGAAGSTLGGGSTALGGGFNAAADSAAASKALGYTGAELGNIMSPAATAAGSGVGGLLSSLSPYAGIIGAGLGALSSKDQTQTTTSSKDPWGPAQQWIKDNMAAGQALQKQYTDNPFSEQQKTAYNNLGGLLNSANANNTNMNDFINRQMSGASYYDPKDPRKNYGKGVAQSNTFAPGLLNYFPK